jgi:orotidine-5'-phosphate decarboxylase
LRRIEKKSVTILAALPAERRLAYPRPSWADRLGQSIRQTGSFLVAGLDPQIETFPDFIVSHAAANTRTGEDFFYSVLTSYYTPLLPLLASSCAAFKPNVAFFEQYGLGGLRALSWVCSAINDLGAPVIADAKRGDIGSTAEAYRQAFFGGRSIAGRSLGWIKADALTVNPFLGFDTMNPFLEACRDQGAGLFVLVKTSNSDSAALQGHLTSDAGAPARKICDWLAMNASAFLGSEGFSGLGAVIGATHPDEGRFGRTLLPTNLVLVPGFGAQGGSANDAVVSFVRKPGAERVLGRDLGGTVVNASRALFAGAASDQAQLCEVVSANALRLSGQLNDALRQTFP